MLPHIRWKRNWENVTQIKYINTVDQIWTELGVLVAVLQDNFLKFGYFLRVKVRFLQSLKKIVEHFEPDIRYLLKV